jgi:P-type Ca2+ transporter type 2C
MPAEEKKTVDHVAYPWHARTKEECIAELNLGNVLEKTGLTSSEAAERLAKYGHNQLSEKARVSIWQRIWHQIANVLVGVLLFVAFVSAIRAVTATDSNTRVTNWIQVSLIVLVIT